MNFAPNMLLYLTSSKQNGDMLFWPYNSSSDIILKSMTLLPLVHMVALLQNL